MPVFSSSHLLLFTDRILFCVFSAYCVISIFPVDHCEKCGRKFFIFSVVWNINRVFSSTKYDYIIPLSFSLHRFYDFKRQTEKSFWLQSNCKIAIFLCNPIVCNCCFYLLTCACASTKSIQIHRPSNTCSLVQFHSKHSNEYSKNVNFIMNYAKVKSYEEKSPHTYGVCEQLKNNKMLE